MNTTAIPSQKTAWITNSGFSYFQASSKDLVLAPEAREREHPGQ